MNVTQDELIATVRMLADRQAIRDCIYNYCRAMDRMDRELLLAQYHEDAIDDHGLFVGKREEFADWAFAYHAQCQHSTQHIVTNHTCELDDDIAHAETYWMMAAMNVQGAPLSLGGGRYIDRFERRAGHWAIATRKCLLDWSGAPGEVPMPQAALDAFMGAGMPARDRSDPSYERPLKVAPQRVGYRFA